MACVKDKNVKKHEESTWSNHFTLPLLLVVTTVLFDSGLTLADRTLEVGFTGRSEGLESCRGERGSTTCSKFCSFCTLFIVVWFHHFHPFSTIQMSSSGYTMTTVTTPALPISKPGNNATRSTRTVSGRACQKIWTIRCNVSSWPILAPILMFFNVLQTCRLPICVRSKCVP